MMLWAVLACCAIAGCDEKEEVAPDPVAATPEPTKAPEPAQAEPAQPEPAQPEPAQPEQPAATIDLERLRALVNGGSSFAVNERGVVFVAVFEQAGEPDDPNAMPTSPDGHVRVAERLCGDAATAASAAAVRTLKFVLDLPADEQMVTCTGNVCTKTAQGEYDTEDTYTFDTSGETPVLVQVVEIETPGIPDEIVAQSRAWAEGERTRLESAECTTSETLRMHVTQ
jgi:hypothetical protein